MEANPATAGAVGVAQPATPGSRLDLQELKRRQQAAWSAGDFGVIGAKILIVSELLCEAVDLRAGECVLDVACGHGNTALAAARRSALVVGLDYVPALLERARERAAAERLAVDWRDGDAEQLPYPDRSFDVVLSTFGVMFAPDQPRAARELARVCRPGGRLGLACWTPDGFAGEMFRTVGRHVPALTGGPVPSRWGTEQGLQELLGGAFPERRAERRTYVMRFESADHWLEVFRNWFGPVRTAFAALDADAQVALARDLTDLARRHDRSGGTTLVIPMEYLEVVATRA